MQKTDNIQIAICLNGQNSERRYIWVVMNFLALGADLMLQYAAPSAI
jgi:hypothetical protein